MSGEPDTYVLDTGPLSHFAKSQWLGVLKAVLSDYRVVIPDVVEQELRNGVGSYPHLRMALDAAWIETVALDEEEQLLAFSRYSQHLVGADGRNLGESGVLALAETLPAAVAVVDDRVAAKTGRENGIQVRGTLGLLCDSIREGLLSVALVSALADDLLVNEYRLPFTAGGFAQWATEQGLV